MFFENFIIKLCTKLNILISWNIMMEKRNKQNSYKISKLLVNITIHDAIVSKLLEKKYNRLNKFKHFYVYVLKSSTFE